MKSEDLINLLGFSIKSDSLQQLITELKIDTELREFHKQQAYKSAVDLKNESNDIILIFNGYVRYKEEYGEPKVIFDTSGDELILSQIFFYNEDENAKSPFFTELPFGLKFKDSIEKVILKIGKKPSDKHKTDSGSCLFFKMNEFLVAVFLNKENSLMSLNIYKHEKAELEKIKLKAELKSQKENIKPDNVDLIQGFRNSLPTNDWKMRIKEGGSIYGEEGINAIELILDEYIEQISLFTKSKKASNIFNSIKKVVNKINKANSKHDSFIHTLEREELCDFIEKVIKATGFEVKEGVDLTEEWREW